MTGVPLITNGGLLLLAAAVLLVVWLAATGGEPPRYRCHVCGITFRWFPDLIDHDMEHHRPARGCGCGAGTAHHPGCPTRVHHGDPA